MTDHSLQLSFLLQLLVLLQELLLLFIYYRYSFFALFLFALGCRRSFFNFEFFAFCFLLSFLRTREESIADRSITSCTFGASIPVVEFCYFRLFNFLFFRGVVWRRRRCGGVLLLAHVLLLLHNGFPRSFLKMTLTSSFSFLLQCFLSVNQLHHFSASLLYRPGIRVAGNDHILRQFLT